MEARHYLVNGRVQGVGYRYFVQSAARRLGLSGWVRNLPDGRVECTAAGTFELLEALERELRKGPAMSRVESVDVQPAAIPADSGFAIR